MALTATATDGFEPFGSTSGQEVFYLPGDPGVTYTRGDRVGIGGLTSEASATNGLGGVLKGPSVTGDKNLVGRVMRTTVCPAATQAFPKPIDFDPVYNNAEDKCLVPVSIDVPAGVRKFRVTFASQVDDTVVSWTPSTRIIVGTTGHAADSYPIGAMVYVYEGPGAGECNVVEAYTHATKSLTLHRNFNATLTTASKYIVLSGEAAVDTGIPLMGRIDAADLNNLTAADGSNDGQYLVFCDWRTIGKHMSELTLPVIRADVMYNA
jgi:hypothetical protein